jgi:hypothetical protein
MSRYLLITAAGVLTLALAGPAHAHGPSRSYVSFGSSHYSTYHGGPSYNFASSNSFRFNNYGTKFSHGYYFGRNNFYWNQRYFSSRYGCYCYWNPYVSSWYYWYAPGSVYYPVSYITIAPPTVTIAPPAVTVVAPAPGVPGVVGSVPPPSGPPMP